MFPADDYTPYGYLANPAAVARSWREGEGGALRSTETRPGFGWWYPFHQRATAGCVVELALLVDGSRVETREDWRAFGLTSRHHGARLFTFDATEAGFQLSARFYLAEPHALLCAVTLENRGAAAQELGLAVRLRAWDNAQTAVVRVLNGALAVDSTPFMPVHILAARPPIATARADDGSTELLYPPLAPGQRATLVAALARGDDARGSALRALAAWEPALVAARREDDAFWAGAARLEGDWPAAWRRGWVYDLETARVCLNPAGGLYNDVWPIWSANWPRSVLAEAGLDCLRLAFGDPQLARRAMLSLFRDAPAANLPCVFRDGEPNMVAADGQPCGTSPAWCLPIQALGLLESLAPDPDWQAALYPRLAGYVEWWLARRADSDGWLSYHCTWESGEDGTPRLDLGRSGSGVIDGFVRPVELQASMAQAAGLLARWARALGLAEDVERWDTLRVRYLRLTRAMWDRRQRRFRDRDRTGWPLPPSGHDYWGKDPIAASVLALVAALDGVASKTQRRHLAEWEVKRFLGPPWSLWPSWTWVVAESAHALGRRDLAARLAASILERVYPENDRRPHAPDGGPLPGIAREWWPLDLSTGDAGEAYGWGATTALLLLRHVAGVLDDPIPERIRLAPALPPSLLLPGQRYLIANLPYRGLHLDVEYAVRALDLDASVRVRETGKVRRVRVPNFGLRSLQLA